ncbi:site-specific integrase [Cupriavidus oxalaticus]|uniref:Site-specific integrase n=1 Tax=Cupriavidus oxalaticus TaxID=96344 RepID=A0A5P3VKV0_9BURK|nr:site-specific integrase [Cupriavidus oxalaticus]QEZ46012.1 site-specific integrase [Cupriavidus oxalaticus]
MATQAQGLTTRSAYTASPVRLSSAPNRMRLSVREITDAYMANYAGHDRSRPQVLARWCQYLGDWLLSDLNADAIGHALDDMAQTPIRRYVGKDDAGEPIYKDLNLPTPATVARWRALFSAVLTWAIRRRLTPKGWINPCREIELESVRNARIRFLTEGECKRLLRVSRLSSWPKLYLLILMGITTGARRGELMRLRYRDISLAAGTAHLPDTKNGDPRVLPLTAPVLDELRRFGRPASPDHLLFGRPAYPDRPFHFQKPWLKALQDARIEDFRFHDLRHTCASYLAQNGGGLHDIANVLGHRQLDVTRRYAHLTIDSKAALVGRVMGDIA